MMLDIVSVLETIVPGPVTALVIAAIILVCINKYREFKKMSQEERVKLALKVIKNEILKLMSEAELDWCFYEKTGEIKKSQVISEIYDRFPFLRDYVNQDDLIKEIDKIIDSKKEIMDNILKPEKVTEEKEDK